MSYMYSPSQFGPGTSEVLNGYTWQVATEVGSCPGPPLVAPLSWGEESTDPKRCTCLKFMFSVLSPDSRYSRPEYPRQEFRVASKSPLQFHPPGNCPDAHL